MFLTKKIFHASFVIMVHMHCIVLYLSCSFTVISLIIFIVPCLHFIERQNIFSSCVSSTQFFKKKRKLGLCLFIYPHPLYFSPKLFFPKLVLFFLFLQGEKLFFNLCGSQGELLLFIGGVVALHRGSCLYFSYCVAYVFCLPSNQVVFVNT